jgi:hypothetical protein
LDRRLGGSQKSSRRRGEEKIISYRDSNSGNRYTDCDLQAAGLYRDKKVPLFHTFQAISETYGTSFTMGTGGCFSRVKAAEV